MESVLVAFSGGVDSTLLLKIASEVLGEKALAVTASSEIHPSGETKSAVKLAKSIGVRHEVIGTKEMLDEKFLLNGRDRCYFCKRAFFAMLAGIAGKEGLNHLADGSSSDDMNDFRPGSGAKKEFGVRSPLAEAGLAKHEIRDLSRELGLPTWDKPSLACLASRVPYGTRITVEILKMIADAESYIGGMGFREVRVRHHGNTARVEVGKSEIPKFLDEDIMDDMSAKLESLGFTYVTLDLKGYRTGSMNEVLG